MGHRKAVGSGVWTLEQLRVEARSTGDQNCDSHPSQTRDVTRLRVSTDSHQLAQTSFKGISHQQFITDEKRKHYAYIC